MTNRVLILFVSILFLFSCKKEQNTVVQLCPEEFKSEAQLHIGEVVNEHIQNDETNFSILNREDHTEAYEYLEQLFYTMVNTQPMALNLPIYNWEVNIVENDSLRTAFFVPGGQFYVYTGLLKYLEAEHQLLSIIAHELFYVNTDWIPQTIKKEEVINCFLLGDLTLNRDVPEASQIATALPMLPFSSDAVIEADSFSLDVLCPFLYEPLGLREIILKASEDDEILHWLEYRMANISQRLDAISRLVTNCDPGGVRNEESYRKFKEEMLP